MTIAELQKKYGYHKMQQLINSGEAYKSRSLCAVAFALIRAGACYLHKHTVFTAWDGREIAPQSLYASGEEGTLQFVRKFYKQFKDDQETI